MLRRRVVTLLIALLSSVTLMCGGGFDEKEVDCEDAVAHLKECCTSDAPTHVRCRVEDHGCDSTTYPSLTSDEATCILQQSCNAIVKGQMCARAEAAAGYGENGFSVGTEVCR